MIYLKACPKCKGDIELVRDTIEGLKLVCLQCNFTVHAGSKTKQLEPAQSKRGMYG